MAESTGFGDAERQRFIRRLDELQPLLSRCTLVWVIGDERTDRELGEGDRRDDRFVG